MKTLPLLAALALLATASLARADYSHREAFSETHPFNANGEVTLANTNGAVKILTWDRAEVKIEGEKRAETGEELKLIDLSIAATPGALTVKTHLPRRAGWPWSGTIRAEVRITVTVPATAQLRRIDAVNGNVSIDGVRGSVTARSVNGGVTAKGLGADTELSTVNGSIRAEFAAIAPDQKISARTVNGSTTVSLPKDAAFALRARSVNGTVSCEFPITIEGKTSRTRLSGTIGGGSASLQTDTVNGSIHINRL